MAPMKSSIYFTWPCETRSGIKVDKNTDRREMNDNNNNDYNSNETYMHFHANAVLKIAFIIKIQLCWGKNREEFRGSNLCDSIEGVYQSIVCDCAFII